MASRKPKFIYQLMVTLRGIEPPIWRRLLVPSWATLQDLHDILQLSMGWLDYHLFEFTKGGIHYQPPDPENDLSGDATHPTLDPDRISLSTVLFNPGDRMDYLYDFGDAWNHEVTLEAILPRQPGKPRASCLDGARACPPEDCGSIPGYEELVEAMKNPSTRKGKGSWNGWASPMTPRNST